MATVRGTTAAEEMRSRPVDLVEADDIDAAGSLLLDGRVDAVVYDAPAQISGTGTPGAPVAYLPREEGACRWD